MQRYKQGKTLGAKEAERDRRVGTEREKMGINRKTEREG